MTFIAGNYSAVYGPDSLGVIDAGFTLEYTSRAAGITTDVGGGAVEIDAVYQGVEVFVSFVIAEVNAAGAQAAFWPWATTFGKTGAVGRLMTSLAKALILTKCPDAGNQVPSTITFPKAVLAPGFNLQTIFGPVHRKVPIRMRAYPIADNSTDTLSQCAQLVNFTVA